MSDLGGLPPSVVPPDSSPGFTPPNLEQLGLLGTAVTAQTKPCSPVSGDYAIPESVLTDAYNAMCGLLVKAHAPMWFANWGGLLVEAVIFCVNWVLAHLMVIFAPFVTTATKEVLGILDVFRESLDPQMASIGVFILNELMGTEFTADHLPQGSSVADHVARATAVGGIFHDQLIREFTTTGATTLTPSPNAARTMSGFLINFGAATGIIAAIGGMIPFGHVDEVREIGEEVAKNLGLGRLNRMAMKPLVQTLIATPYQWWINQKYHPTQFKLADVVNPFAQTVMPLEQVYAAGDLDGFSHDKIDALIKLHQKRLTLKDAETLKRWGLWTSDQAHKFAVGLGWPEDQAETALSMQEVNRLDARMGEFIKALEHDTIRGNLNGAQLVQILDTLPITQAEKTLISQTIAYSSKMGTRALSVSEVQQAFELQLISASEMELRFIAMGFNQDDVPVLEALTYIKLAKLTEAKKVAQFAYDAKVAKAAKANGPIPPKPPILV